MKKTIELIGQKFGKLTVLSSVRENGRTRLLCKCDCGKEFFTRADALTRSNYTFSCGCEYKELARKRFSKVTTKHGLSGTPIYLTWKAMNGRCFNKRHDDYKYYGARGITVCSAIHSSVLNLIKAIGERPDGMTLDRINNSGNYSCGICDECKLKDWPLNIRWSTHLTQMQNTRRCVHLTIGNRTQILSEWAREIGVSPRKMSWRVKRGIVGEELLKP